MPTPASTLYDEVAYRTLPIPQTHPDRLATIASLHGMQPRPIDQCRVLELGCGDGTNLIPMAYGLPGSEFVGIDLAGTSVAAGTAAISALGLRNIALHHLDVMEVTEALGTFDYIIAPGIYSWVSEPVRDRIQAVCRAHLAPNGVAFVSYNTYPGCHLRQAVWQVLQFHVDGIADTTERLAQARALARLIAECPRRGDEDGGAVLGDEMRAVLDHSTGLLFHDDLAPINVPVYFREFVAHAQRHGLQFLAEANFYEMQEHAYPPEIAKQIERLAEGSLIRKEQYLDFLRNRRFRQTLLCRADVTLDRGLRREVIREMHVGSQARSVSEHVDIASPNVVEEFRGPRGSAMSTAYPLAKAALFHLGRVWPRLVGFDDLLRDVRALLNGVSGGPGPDPSALIDILLAAYVAGLVELSTHAPRFVLEPGPRPTASPVARLQLERGPFVATLRHTSVRIEDDLGRHVLRLMDGSRTREALLCEMKAHVASSVEIGAVDLERKIAEVARLALFVA
jgi:methyltransferase-like protein